MACFIYFRMGRVYGQLLVFYFVYIFIIIDTKLMSSFGPFLYLQYGFGWKGFSDLIQMKSYLWPLLWNHSNFLLQKPIVFVDVLCDEINCRVQYVKDEYDWSCLMSGEVVSGMEIKWIICKTYLLKKHYMPLYFSFLCHALRIS